MYIITCVLTTIVVLILFVFHCRHVVKSFFAATGNGFSVAFYVPEQAAAWKDDDDGVCHHCQAILVDCNMIFFCMHHKTKCRAKEMTAISQIEQVFNVHQ